jgi:hypothetical protein
LLATGIEKLGAGIGRCNGRQAQFPRFKRRGLSDSFRYSGL